MADVDFGANAKFDTNFNIGVNMNIPTEVAVGINSEHVNGNGHLKGNSGVTADIELPNQNITPQGTNGNHLVTPNKNNANVTNNTHQHAAPIIDREKSETSMSSRQQSKFFKEWEAIKVQFHDEFDNFDKELVEIKEEVVGDKTEKNKSGGSDSLGSKIDNADIRGWKEHSMHKLGFFLNEWKKLPEQERVKSFGETSEYPKKIIERGMTLDEFIQMSENSNFINVKKDTQEELLRWSNELRDAYLQNGLSEEEARRRFEEFGPNLLPQKKKTPEIIKWLREISNPFAALFWIVAALAFIMYGIDSTHDTSNLVLACVLVALVLLTGTFSYFQNKSGEDVMEGFKDFAKSTVQVKRSGEAKMIEAYLVVVGDVIVLGSGNKVAADMRIFISTSDLNVDNSSLTGETLPVKLSPNCGTKGLEDPKEAKNLAFFSTLCTGGGGSGVVIKTGGQTFIGRIADLAATAETQETTLQVEIEKLIYFLAIVAISFGVIFFCLGFILNIPPLVSLINAIGLIVANVPEGLLGAITLALTITSKKMFAYNVLVKNLSSIETLGALTCICSDKTGTLTQNKMTVQHIWYDKELFKSKDEQHPIQHDGENGIEELATQTFSVEHDSFNILQLIGVCGSAAQFLTEVPLDFKPLNDEKIQFVNDNPLLSDEEVQKHLLNNIRPKYQKEYAEYISFNIDEAVTNGDASETGMMKFFQKNFNTGYNKHISHIDEMRRLYPIHKCPNPKGEMAECKIPFNSSNKFVAYLLDYKENLDDSNSTNELFVAFKGAPDRLISRCNRFLYQGKEYPMNDEFKHAFDKANEVLALKGERILGCAYNKLDPVKYGPDYQFIKMDPNRVVDPNEEGPGADDFITDIPISNLVFVGLIAMEDPPRPGVKEAISDLKKAHIKVIMVTGDQALTAASIAHQIGIIEDINDTPKIIQNKKKLKTLEEAEQISNSIIIDGDRLNKAYKLDALLSDSNPSKGEYLRKWLMKRDVVFARTSPEQKLIIVNGCQKLSHIVGVTGDGVNDSPAIKKADIGIAMGKVGTDVAKDAADILLLDDHFPNILRGVKFGRTIFDTFKKFTCYNLTNNCFELLMFIGFIILQMPLPLSTILILSLDLFANIYPNIAFATEPAEKKIMERKPRNCKTDHIVTMKMFIYAYLFTGVMDACGGFLTYFVILNNYGMNPLNVIGMLSTEGLYPAPNDVYNPYYDQYSGNSNAFLSANYEKLGIFSATGVGANGTTPPTTINTNTVQDVGIDLRVFYYFFPQSSWGKCFWDDISLIGTPVCYSSEAVFHAQGGVYIAAIIGVLGWGVHFRAIQTSAFSHEFTNSQMNFAYFLQLGIAVFIVFCPGVQEGFGVRSIHVQEFFPAFAFWISGYALEELRKYLVRTIKEPNDSPGYFYRYFYY